MSKPMRLLALFVLSVALVVGISLVYAQTAAPNPDVAALLKPQTDGGKPLMQALQLRRSTRSFAPQELPPQVLSNLLWAAFGVNRPETGQRTAPSARNWQEIDLYLASKDGLFLYLPKSHSLKQLLKDDVRASIGAQAYVQTAPVVLIYVADFDRMRDARPEDRAFYYGADTGFISQNVYLFSASEGLATVVAAMAKPDLAAKLSLRSDQKVVFIQPVGYPGK